MVPPTRRFDIAIEEDLIEEIARIHGYDAIPTTTPAGQIGLAAPRETRVAEAVLRRQLVSREYLEAINYAFVDAGSLAAWQLDAGAVALANPLSSELGVMRTSLLPGLVAALQRKFAPRVAAVAREAHAAAREAAKAARKAAEAARALQALDEELREEEAQRNGAATAEWPANGIGGHCVAIAERMEARAADVASGAERVAADAERIAAGRGGGFGCGFFCFGFC